MATEAEVSKELTTQALDTELEEIAKDAAIARARLVDLEQRRRDITFSKARLTDAQSFAVARQLHDTFCAWNHTDGCGWGYEEDRAGNRDSIGTWASDAHERWLNKAKVLVSQFGTDAVIDAVRIYGEIKKKTPQAFAVIDAARRG